MKSLLAPDSLPFLESLSFTRTLYAFDYDGTLSKIVPNPQDATLSRRTVELLRRFADRVPLAVISGRSIGDLKGRLGFRPEFIVGNHGIEGLQTDSKLLLEARRKTSLWERKLKQFEFGHGVEIENKIFSVAVHFRSSPRKKFVRDEIKRAVASLDPAPRIVTGKSVLNLLSEGAPHKGIALLELMKISNARRAFYIGDDDTDEDVFSLDDPRIVSARIGYHRKSGARYFLRRQSQMNQLLKVLLKHHEKSGSRS